MKRIILFILLHIVVVSTFAQVEIGIGPKVNLNASFISSLPYSDQPVCNVSGGGFLNLKFNNYFALQPELIYKRISGFQNSHMAKTQYREYKVNSATMSYDYLRVPVMVKFYIIKGLNIEIGPDFGFLLGMDLQRSGRGTFKTPVAKKFDVGVSAGISYETRKGVVINARYTEGLMKMAKKMYEDVPIFDTEDCLNMKYRTVEVGIGYKFEIN